MARAWAVIGAGWGDEGKGLMTDSLAQPGGVVARHNGGAQAGHSVQRSGGARHVFHHLASGTLRGAATFLTRFFVHNPLLLPDELRALAALGVTDPAILADPAGQVTTPWDMMLNQMVEEVRGAARHGSCGVGFNETLRRGLDSPFLLRIADLASPDGLRRVARTIQAEWVPARLAALGIELSEAWRRRLGAAGVVEAFVDACQAFSRVVALDDGAAAVAAAHAGALGFEGAQGLLLDADHPFFPHVTHSKTGLPNAGTLAREWGLEGIDAVYVTRAYATRHGAGPFPREVPGLAYPDQTNVPNAWQGTLRSGELDLDLLGAAVAADLGAAGLPVEHRLAMTCLDQIGSAATWWRNERRMTGTPEELVEAAALAIGAREVLVVNGPCREDIRALHRPAALLA